MIYWDIETCAAANAAEFITEPKPPGSIKKAETLAKWQAEELPALREAALEAAALSPITGKVLAIGVMVDETPNLIHGENEAEVLNDFWKIYRELGMPSRRGGDWVGFNTDSFDLPFVWKRSIINGIAPPLLFTERGYPLGHFIDLQRMWQCGDRQAHGSLDVIARLCGFAGKTGSGAQFAILYRSELTRKTALDYLHNDLLLTKMIALRMGVA